MSDFPDVKALLEEIKSAIEKARFVRIPPPPGCLAYQSTSEGWLILVASFPRPNKQRGYDGTATGIPSGELALANPSPMVVRLTPELAKQAGELAERQLLS